MLKQAAEGWTVADAAELYGVERWSQGYVSVGHDGDLLVHPTRDPERSIDLKQLVDRLQLRGTDLPVLLRFSDILRDRMQAIHDAFATAIDDHDYAGSYTCVYPVKVNPQRQVVEKVIEYGSEFHYGLEAGSKPELLAVVAMTDAETPIICNGFKDAEFIEMALLAQKMGRNVIPVVEKFTELHLILEYAFKLNVRPQIGMRVKLATRGSGRWNSSTGTSAKFGLSVGELLQGLDELKQRDMADCFKLLHFHLGSQVTNIRHVKAALNEATRVYTDLAKRGAGLTYLDVGGGLGVDYDGSQTNFESSANYTLQEYANDVVYHVQTVCRDAGVPEPNILSESGRAIAAYHAVLVFAVLGVAEQESHESPPAELPAEYEQPLHTLIETYRDLTARNMLESYHDAQAALEMTMQLFSGGYLPLDQRGLAESLYWSICRRIRRLLDDMDETPEELAGLDRTLADTYFCNFSLFQSMPDSWAIRQLFPILPIHRLDERPTRHAVLGDVTCDSDGRIDQFIDRRDVQRTLPLHAFDGSPYFLAAFLVGAYQEILGDLHNLFGDTNMAVVDLNGDGDVVLREMVSGDRVSDVLRYVQYDKRDLIARLQTAVETAVQRNHLDHREAGRVVRFYEDAIRGYTYLEESGDV